MKWIPLDVPETIKAVLAITGLSQSELARKTGISPPRLCHWKQKSRQPTINEWAAWYDRAKALVDELSPPE